MPPTKKPTASISKQQNPLRWRANFDFLLTAARIFLDISFIIKQIGWEADLRLPAEK